MHYAAGGLFHYVKNGLQSDKTFMKEATEAELKQWGEECQWQWRDGLGLFLKTTEFEPDA